MSVPSDDIPEFEMNEADLAEMDRQFLANMEAKAEEHQRHATESTTGFWMSLVLFCLFVFFICLAIYFFIDGCRHRRRVNTLKKYKVIVED